MKKNILKSILAVTVSVVTLVGCTSADDIAIPPFEQPYFFADFKNYRVGSNIEIPGTINKNFTNSILWTVRSNNGNNAMQFSSYYSAANTSDNVWFILPEVNLEANKKVELSFKLAQAYPNGAFPLEILYSLDFDGNPDHIENAVWTAMPFTFSETEYNKYAPINGLTYLNESIDLQKVYYAFNYKGSKTDGRTTTITVDNIKLIIN
jgi:hypothetical protein